MTTFKKLSTLLTVLALTLCLVFSFASCNLIGGECEHADNDKDHKCDECGEVLSECADADKNHKCDYCDGNVGGECADKNNDHNCDYCGTAITECADADNDHECDLCGETASECADEDKDHYCDICDDEISKCADADPKDHKCDICGETSSQCVDQDKDHVCDWCGGNVGGECADSETDYDHACDYCGAVLADCADGDDADHACDVCAKSLCADGEDADHNCDVCQMNLCDDADNNHACDVCEAKLCYDSADRGHTCDVCGDLLCKDADDDKACDVCGDPVNAETLPVITVYVEGANCTVNGKAAVRFYGDEADKAVVPAYTADQYIIDLWVVYNGEGTKIAYLENGDAFVPAENGKYYIAPIFLATNLGGVGDEDVSLDVSSGDKITNDVLTPEWADVDASKKLTIFGTATGQYPNHILNTSNDSQLYITTDPTNSANVVLMHATRTGGTSGFGTTAIEIPIAAGSKGDSYFISFDYYLDHNCSGADSTDMIVVKDSNGVDYKIGVIVPTKNSMKDATTDTTTPTENAFRIAGRYYKENAKGYLTGNDDKLYTDAGGDTVYLSSDTWYTFSLEIKANVITTYYSLRGSDERTVVSTYDYANFSISEKDLVSFRIDAGLYNSQRLAYFDNLYFGKQHKCVDADSNHACDECAAKLCVDGKDLDHLCDVCGDSLCYEGEISDHYCDGCGAKLSDCADEAPKNHYCDICGKGGFGGNECVDADPKADGHNCNYCGANLCVDVEPKNHVCDVCEAVLSECVDADENHDCDYCGKEDISVCVDDDKNHDCDLKGCEAVIGEHADATGDKDHLCEYCGKEASECVDTDTNYICDECEKALCYDLDKDHICDIEAHKATGEKLSECVDENKDHVCDFEGCKAAVGTHADGETVNHVCEYCGKYNIAWCADVNKDHICDLEECGKKISYCADTDADNKCDHCGEHVCSDDNVDGICDNCTKVIVYNFEIGKLDSSDRLNILTTVSNVNKLSNFTAEQIAEATKASTSLTTDARPEGYNYATYMSLGVDPENAANQVLSLQTTRVEGGGANSPSYATATPVIVDAEGDYTVMKFRMYIGTVDGSAKAYHDVLYLYMIDEDGTSKKATVGYRGSTASTNAAGNTVYNIKSCGKDIAATTNMWVDLILVNDNSAKKYYAYYSVDGGVTYTYANGGTTGLKSNVTSLKFEANAYQVNSLALVDDWSNVRVSSVSIPLADGTTAQYPAPAAE